MDKYMSLFSQTREKRRNDIKEEDNETPVNKKRRVVEEKDKEKSWFKFPRSAPATPIFASPSTENQNVSEKRSISSASSEPIFSFITNSAKNSLTRTKAKTRGALPEFKKPQNNENETEDDDMKVEDTDIDSQSSKSLSHRDFAKLTLPLHDQLRTVEDFNNYYKHREVIIVPSTKRDHVGYEILTTEDTYVRLLQTCDLIYNHSLEKWSKCLSMLEANILHSFFGSFRDIINVNSILLNSMRDRFSVWHQSQRIGDIISTIAPFLKTYKNYAELYEPALFAMDHFKKKEPNGTFIEILRNGEIHPLSQGYKIDSLLILPIQRVPRYSLLLKELLTLTPPEHEDFLELQSAIMKIEGIAQDINKAIREAESRAYCIQFQKNLDTKCGTVALPIPSIVEAHRKFLREGNAARLISLLERHYKRIVLFNDILLVCTQLGTFKGGKYAVDHTFFLENTSVAHSPLTPDTFEIKDDIFHVILMVENAEVKQEWLIALAQAITRHKLQTEENRLRGISVPRELIDKEQAYNDATKCSRCDKEFIFFYFPRKKHLCRGCGTAVCGDCSMHRIGDETRVCDLCWKKSNSGVF